VASRAGVNGQRSRQSYHDHAGGGIRQRGMSGTARRAAFRARRASFRPMPHCMRRWFVEDDVTVLAYLISDPHP
jgi:hypothetical protein